MWNSVDKLGLNWRDYLTHNEYSRLTNTSLGLTPTTYFLSVRFWRLSNESIPVFGSGTLPTPGVFPRKVWTIQSPWMSPLYLSSLNADTSYMKQCYNVIRRILNKMIQNFKCSKLFELISATDKLRPELLIIQAFSQLTIISKDQIKKRGKKKKRTLQNSFLLSLSFVLFCFTPTTIEINKA